MNNSLSKDQFKKFLKDKKIFIPILVLILLNIKIFILNIKFNIKSKNDPYKVENMINILSKFKPHILIHITFNLIFLITPEDQIWHINTAYYRLNMQLVPAFFLITQFMIKKNIQNISLLPPKPPKFST
jgi:hypothetical protein